MTIVQITDIHIGLEGEETFDTDVRSNFRRLLDLTRRLRPDHLVISGDLCFRDAQRPVYEWVRRQLDDTGLPYDLLSGNHDEPGLMATVFDREHLLTEGELFYTRQVNGHSLICLDTTPGALSGRQMTWLDERLREQSGPALVFMHHPPLLAGVPYMDQHYALQNQEEVAARFFAHPHPVHVFCGHYHVDKIIHRRNLAVYITPSGFFQIDQTEADFRVDHRRPGLRTITCRDRTLMSTVYYLDM